MRFNYKLYRPKKVIKDISASTGAYFRAKDVQVSPLTKIGDVAEMPQSEKRPEIRKTTERKPIFTGAFDRSRFAIRKRPTATGRTMKRPTVIPVAITDDYPMGRQRVSVRRITNKSLSSAASIRQRLMGLLHVSMARSKMPRVLGAALGMVVVGVGLVYVHAYDMTVSRSSVTIHPKDVQPAGGTDAITNQQKDKAKKKAQIQAEAEAKKNADQQKAAADIKKHADSSATDTTGQADNTTTSGGYDRYNSSGLDTSTSSPDEQPAAPAETPVQSAPTPAPIPVPLPDPPVTIPPVQTTPDPELPTPIPNPHTAPQADSHDPGIVIPSL